MHAVVQVGSQQFDVSPGQLIRVEKIDGKVGNEIRMNRVLMLAEGDSIRVGKDVKGAVYGVIKAQDRAPKIIVFKKNRRKGYTKTQGHRQPQTTIKITRIEANGGNE